MTMRFPRGLYGITPDWADTDRMLAAVEQAHAGGMAAVQWRRKHGSLSERRTQLLALRRLALDLGLLLIVNDDWRLAADVDADGVHMGRDDGSIAQARMALGSEKIIGCSCYDQPDLAARRLAEDVDYVAFGAVYPSQVKPGAVRATLDHIHAGHRLAQDHHPRAAVVAIGGITPDNAAPVIEAGADSIAVISALFEAADIRQAAARCAALFA
ncbi:thiamine phosphate synthase [Castellaniella sp. GW247-6E4]|uniref:thiamine phosphate synthase n=1 Tax=Castellaniella sp. GW247-6E4 TaxID=3140380 RepID=UPI003315D5E0